MKATSAERPRLSPMRPDLPQEIDGWVARALAIRSEDRFPYVTTMWNDLLRIVMMGSTPSARKARETFGALLAPPGM